MGAAGKNRLSEVSLLYLGLFLILISCSREAVGEEDLLEAFPDYAPMELEILDLVNDHRASAGLKELQILDEISYQAELHNEHMISTKEVCHHNFGSRYSTLARKVGAKAMGENVGCGYRTAEAFLSAWLNSSNHKVIIEGDHTHFGISANPADEKIYVTLIFIRN